MSKLLFYIGEDKKFDVNATINAITSIEGVSNARQRNYGVSSNIQTIFVVLKF
jgi:hypothetical protein